MTTSDTPRFGDGRVSAHVFENRSTGLARGLFWIIHVPIVDLVHDGEIEHAALSIEWARFDVREWRDLVGHEVRDDGMTEGSFYAGCEHHWPDELTLRFLSRDGTTFRVAIDVAAELDALDGRVVRVHGETALRFTDVAIIRDNLFPKPSTLEEARLVVEPYLDVSAFAGWTRNERGDFLLVPDEATLLGDADGE